MASQKITELTSYPAPATTDVLPVVDLSTTTTKKATLAALVGAVAIPESQVTGLTADLAARVLSSDSRLSDARTPTAHATSHKNGGSDEVSTAASAANGIPKGSAGGVLAPGWLRKYLLSSATGTQNNWAPGLDGDTFMEWAGLTDLTATGIAGGVADQVFTFRNTGAANAFFPNASGSSLAPARFTNAVTSGSTPVAPGGWAQWIHNGTNWILVNHEQGNWITPAYSAGTFFGNGAQTWGVDSGDIIDFSYRLSGRTLEISFYLTTTTVGGTPNTGLQFTIPGGFTSAGNKLLPCFTNDAGAGYVTSFVQADASSATITISKTSGANFSAATNTTRAVGVIPVTVT